MSDEKRMKPPAASFFFSSTSCMHLHSRLSAFCFHLERKKKRRADETREKAKRDARLGNCIQLEVLPQISLYLAQCWQPPSVTSKAPKISRALAGFKEDLDGYMQTDTTDGFSRFKMRERQLDECSSLITS
jgi:hypothetical protein